MLKCLMKYEWVKLRRDTLPTGKGIMGAWAKLAARAAFRKGHASYCGYKNAVSPGMWSGGIVGLKSILGIRSRTQALEVMDKLSALGYLKYTLDGKTKKLTYQLTDWVVKCSGEECMNGTVYATDGFGFLCLPRNITQRLVEEQYIFDEADAWLDLWCHTVSEEPGNAFSFMAPAVQYGNYGTILTMEKLGQRWGWEKTKVWRFFKKHGDVFALYRLPGSYGCLVFNKSYPMDTEVSLPKQTEILRILDEIRIWGANTHKVGSDNDYINRLVAWYSRNAVEKSIHNELVGTLSECEPGLYELAELRYGGYFLYEKQAPVNYVKDNGYHYFEIVNDGELVEVENKAGIGFINDHMNSSTSIPEPEDTADLTDQTQAPATTEQNSESTKKAESGIPTLHIILFAGGMVIAIGTLIVMQILKKKRENESPDDEEDEE